MKRMAKMNLIQISLLIFGTVLALWGILLPWKCYRGIVYMCMPGLGFDWTILFALNPVRVSFLVLTIGVAYFVFRVSKSFREAWQTAVIAIIIGAFIFFVVGTPIVIDGGGFFFALGMLAVIWLNLSMNWEMAIRRIVPILLVVFAALNLFEPVGSRLANEFPGEIESTGRLLLFLGSLLMLGASLLKQQQAQREAA